MGATSSYVESGYGFGETVCKARGFVRWGPEDDCDSVVFVSMLFIPVFPQKSIHTYDWNGKTFQAIPIRSSGMLIFRAMIRRCLFFPLYLGMILVLLLGISLLDSREGLQRMRVVLPMIILPLLGISGLGFWLLSRADQRCRRIRWVLGPHSLGSSDPATWTEEVLRATPAPLEMFGTHSYAEAVLALLEAKEFARAMWAARLAVAVENRHGGEQLTDSILQAPKVLVAIEQVRKTPQIWREVMNSADPATT